MKLLKVKIFNVSKNKRIRYYNNLISFIRIKYKKHSLKYIIIKDWIKNFNYFNLSKRNIFNDIIFSTIVSIV
jgi:hypothetical protein